MSSNSCRKVVLKDKEGKDNAFYTPQRYENLVIVGKGAFGSVVKCRDNEKKQMVAIKKIEYNHHTAAFMNVLVGKRIHREIVLLKKIKHPNIVRMEYVYTPATTSNELQEVYIVMESMDATLDQAEFRGNHKLISFISYQILCAVNYLHNNKITHRDLKPCNIGVISQDCIVKLLDFGLAREVDDGMTAYVVTRPWRAPEVVFRMDYDHKVDMWSVGCIIAGLIVGRSIFAGQDSKSLLEEILMILGTPDDSFIGRIEYLEAQQYVKSLPHFQATPWTQLIPDRNFDINTAQNAMTGRFGTDSVAMTGFPKR